VNSGMTLYKIQRLPPFPSHVTQLSQLAERIQFRRVRCRVRSIGPPMPVIPEIADTDFHPEINFQEYRSMEHENVPHHPRCNRNEQGEQSGGGRQLPGLSVPIQPIANPAAK